MRVLLVDDSSVSRALMGRWIEDGGAVIAGAVSNGRAAIDAVARLGVDVVVLDIEMPELDGLSALPGLLAAAPGVQVLMASSLSEQGAEVTLQALRLGAVDAIAKPRAGWAAGGGAAFRAELNTKIATLGAAARRGDRVAVRVAEAEPLRVAAVAVPVIRPAPMAIVIGASTGGPNALFKLLAALPPLTVPLFITQHMPPMFTAILAQHFARYAGVAAAEAKDGERVEPGRIYVAPGALHMTVRGSAGQASIALDDGPPVNFCKPSVDPLMASVAAVYGAGVLGVMLTGMGSDGLEGARAIVAGGGAMIVQDQISSVVWGMPGAVAKAGLAEEVVPLDSLAACIARRLGGER